MYLPGNLGIMIGVKQSIQTDNDRWIEKSNCELINFLLSVCFRLTSNRLSTESNQFCSII